MSNIWANLLTILVGGLLVNNFVMNRFLGCCPFLGVSKQYDTAKGMSMAVIFVMTLASFITWFVQHLILVPLHLEYMQTIAFILVIAVLVGIVEMALKKISPSLYQSLGVYLPLITTNCAVLGVAILNVDNGYNLLESTFNGFCAAAAVGGAIASLSTPVVPLHDVALFGLQSLSSLYTDDELDKLLQAGVTPVQLSGGRMCALRILTTRAAAEGPEPPSL